MPKLIVQETDQEVLETLRVALGIAGFNVLCTTSYDDLLVQIDLFRPHVVMLDFKLSGELCTNACNRIKKEYPDLPVLALSCNVNINSEYKLHGFDDYIRKPFDLDVLYSILRKHIPPVAQG
jgi:DNA-binding response OmpR family regulator